MTKPEILVGSVWERDEFTLRVTHVWPDSVSYALTQKLVAKGSGCSDTESFLGRYTPVPDPAIRRERIIELLATARVGISISSVNGWAKKAHQALDELEAMLVKGEG